MTSRLSQDSVPYSNPGSSEARFRGTFEKARILNYPFRGFSMYAVIKTGGKQYKVAAGQKLKVEQMPADIGAEVTLDQVLAVGSGDTLVVGTPLVAGATVSATVLSIGRHDKVRIFKMRRRKHYQKRQGHRQNYTELFITAITSAAGSRPVRRSACQESLVKTT